MRFISIRFHPPTWYMADLKIIIVLFLRADSICIDIYHVLKHKVLLQQNQTKNFISAIRDCFSTTKESVIHILGARSFSKYWTPSCQLLHNLSQITSEMSPRLLKVYPNTHWEFYLINFTQIQLRQLIFELEGHLI